MQNLEILISCPGDVANEFLEFIKAGISDYNEQTGNPSRLNLLPLHWKEHAHSQCGGHPQELLNKQLVDRCKVLIAVFKWRLGSPTVWHESGSVEEIHLANLQGKPVFIFFFDGAPDLDSLPDTERTAAQQSWNDLCASKQRLGSAVALYSTYTDGSTLRASVLKNLRNAHTQLTTQMASSVAPSGDTTVRNGCPQTIQTNTVTNSPSSHLIAPAGGTNTFNFPTASPVAPNPVAKQLTEASEK